MGALGEGVESLKLACSLVLLIPALGVVLLGRRRIWLVPGWILTVTLIAWLRFVGWWAPLPSGGWHIAAGLALVGLGGFAWTSDTLAADLAATVAVAFVAGWSWIPCVGSELGEILNNAPAEPWVELGPTLLYLVGLFIPLILFVAAEVAFPKFGEAIELEWVRGLGVTIILVVGALVALTLFDDLAGELFRRSSF